MMTATFYYSVFIFWLITLHMHVKNLFSSFVSGIKLLSFLATQFSLRAWAIGPACEFNIVRNYD